MGLPHTTAGSKTQRPQHYLTKKLMDEESVTHKEFPATLHRSQLLLSRLARKGTALAMPRDLIQVVAVVKTTA